MDITLTYRDTFTVVGKLGSGAAVDGPAWIPALWEDANAHVGELAFWIKKDSAGAPAGVWGIMSDMNETFARWDANGKYLAGCETRDDACPPAGWTKWNVPAQTYVVVSCTQKEYGQVFPFITEEFLPAHGLCMVGAAHEHYPVPGRADPLELYFPVAQGYLLCQSCGMPLTDSMMLGRNADGTPNYDYCLYCYPAGKFSKEETMEQMIERCIPFLLEDRVYSDADSAREIMRQYFPMLKRWKQEGS